EVEPIGALALRPADEIPDQRVRDRDLEIAGSGSGAREVACAGPVPPSPGESEQRVGAIAVGPEQPHEPRRVGRAAREGDHARPVPQRLVVAPGAWKRLSRHLLEPWCESLVVYRPNDDGEL